MYEDIVNGKPFDIRNYVRQSWNEDKNENTYSDAMKKIVDANKGK